MNHPAGRIGRRLTLRVSDLMLRSGRVGEGGDWRGGLPFVTCDVKRAGASPSVVPPAHHLPTCLPPPTHTHRFQTPPHVRTRIPLNPCHRFPTPLPPQERLCAGGRPRDAHARSSGRAVGQGVRLRAGGKRGRAAGGDLHRWGPAAHAAAGAVCGRGCRQYVAGVAWQGRGSIIAGMTSKRPSARGMPMWHPDPA